ncbi:MAG TPA: UdgX family uracil-DNA binding protein [Acidimicrobiales bacterium]|nr:UdgX family uracil-DNA binding protein [Acidimicrobiales bacterium]
MTATGPPASSLVPPEPTIDQLREAASGCQACELWQLGTQTVFGEGPVRARVLLVGEQPGDQEDRQGHPFVGPAGRVLDEALAAAGIARDDVYVTNAVKHFRWEARGKRRIHKKPSVEHVDACRPWLEAEIATVRPEVVVCLGATAAQALLGRSFRVSRQRGELVRREDGSVVTATVHPSSILRSQDTRVQEMEAFVADLRAVGDLLRAPG